MSSPNDPKFKVGEKCYCDFLLQTIKETEENRINCVSDGVCSHSGYDLSDECFPDIPIIKEISDFVHIRYKLINEIDFISLNYPDIHRFLITTWCEMCKNKHNEIKLEELREKLDMFVITITNKIHDIKTFRLHGVRIIG